MDIKKEVVLTTGDIEEIVKAHLSKTGRDVENINFIIIGEEDPADLFAALPLTYVLKGAICK